MDSHHVTIVEDNVGKEALVAPSERRRNQLRNKPHGAELTGAWFDEKGFVQRSGRDVTGQLVLDMDTDNLVK
jgi:hypothetical protein